MLVTHRNTTCFRLVLAACSRAAGAGCEGFRTSVRLEQRVLGTLVWGSCCHFFQHKRRDQRALVQLTLYAIGCLPSLPCRRCVTPANSAPGGKASLLIGSRKKGIETRKKCIALLQTTFCRATSNRRQNGRGYPVQVCALYVFD